jgi:predicted GNAT superfamily acetyltransferase
MLPFPLLKQIRQFMLEPKRNASMRESMHHRVEGLLESGYKITQHTRFHKRIAQNCDEVAD